MTSDQRRLRSPSKVVVLLMLGTGAVLARPAHAVPFLGAATPAAPASGAATATTGAPSAPASSPAQSPTPSPTPTPTPSPTPSGAPLPTSAPSIPANRPPPPVDASSALERARAAYEYGDIDEMVESARQVSDGRLHPTPAQRAYALRLLGIGLFLTGRPEGAETAFFELLRLRPESRLDPQTTRPDAVAFFEQVRLRYAEPIRDAARASNRKTFFWNFFPPAGQFQNGHRGRAFTIAGVELVSLATAITTLSLLNSWVKDDLTFPDEDLARTTKTINYVSVGVFAATVAYGIIDGIAHYGDQPDDSHATTTARLSITPGGLSLNF